MKKTMLLGMNALVIAGMCFCSAANAGSDYHSNAVSKYATAYTKTSNGSAYVTITVANHTAYLSINEVTTTESGGFSTPASGMISPGGFGLSTPAGSVPVSTTSYWNGTVPLRYIHSPVAGGNISINVDTCTLTSTSDSGVGACGPVDISIRSSSIAKRFHGTTQIDFNGQTTTLSGLYTQYNSSADGTVSMNGNVVTFGGGADDSAAVYTGNGLGVTVSGSH